MPYRFHVRMGKWGTGIEKHGLWDLLFVFLILLALFLVFLAII
jgi:hypothetical protein